MPQTSSSSSASYSQTSRPIKVTTPLGGDVLLIERFRLDESTSKQFEMELELLSTDAAIDPKALLRQGVTVTLELLAGGQRHFHGLVRRFVQQGRVANGLVSYRAEVVPACWFLSLTTDCRIFQQKTVPEILKAVLGDGGVTFRLALTGSYEPREYCVQYRESHLNFISRLMEDEGIFYFFEHAQGSHTMVIADAPSAVKAGPQPKLRVHAGEALEDVITELEINSEVVSGKVTLVDYNDTMPKRMEGTVSSTQTSAFANLSQFDYPGKFEKVPDAERYARLRLEQSESRTKAIVAATNYRGLSCGQKLEISDHYRKDANQAYHVIAVSHAAQEGSYRSDGEPFSYMARFECIPAAVPFRPPPVTPKAIVRGTQTALVVGPAGQEIYTDKHGRVKVQFFWDQAGKKDEKSSCWVRVSSTWAGKQWGAIHLPRITQEVVVDFLEGDPDRPIIVGSVYNAEQMPPYALPDNMTQSGVKSRSTLKGGTADFNEFRFEDKKDSEQIFLHAQKDFAIEVENDETHLVEANRKKTINKDETVVVKGNRTETVTKNETIKIEQGNRAVTLSKGNDALVLDMGNLETKVSMGNVQTKVSMGNIDTKVAMGNVTLKADLGKVAYDAMQGIEFKVGQSSIKIDQMGVTIKGMMVKIEGQIMTEVKGMMTKVNADAILMVKGSLTMIN